MRDRIHESQLDNGLKVLTVENPVSPTASVQVWYRVGSRNERTGITGASHIFEHMMFKGTERFPKGVFDRIIQENGMTNNAFTSYDYTAYFENMANDRLEVAFELEADRMQGLLLQPEEFESEISVIREERRQTREDPPFGLITEAVDAAVFQAHPYHWPVIGWMTDLETITRDDLIAYYKVYYRPNNATLVVVGDVSHERVADLAQMHFGGIARGPEVPTVLVVEPEQLGERSVRVHKDVQLPGIVIAYRAPEVSHADAAAMNIAEYILFRGRSSRLYQRLIHQEPLAVDLSGGFYVRKDPSTFVVRAMARPEVEIERLRTAAIGAVESFESTPPTSKEIEKARNQIDADFLFGQEHNFELGTGLGSYECLCSWKHFFDFHQACLAVSAEDIVRAARTWLHERGRTSGYLIAEGGEE
jgi:zinc protease